MNRGHFTKNVCGVFGARALTRMATILLVSFPGITSAASSIESQEEPNICQSVLRNVIPIVHTREQYPLPRAGEGETSARYVGHDLYITKFSLLASHRKLVFASGTLFSNSDTSLPLALHYHLALMTLENFQDRNWNNTDHFSDIENDGELQLDRGVRLISSVAFFLSHGDIADRALRSPSLTNLLSSSGVRGSRIQDWYDCQTCGGAPAFTRYLGQDLSTMRVAEVNRQLYLVTTSPRLIIARIDEGHPRAKYYMCSVNDLRLLIPHISPG